MNGIIYLLGDLYLILSKNLAFGVAVTMVHPATGHFVYNGGELMRRDT